MILFDAIDRRLQVSDDKGIPMIGCTGTLTISSVVTDSYRGPGTPGFTIESSSQEQTTYTLQFAPSGSTRATASLTHSLASQGVEVDSVGTTITYKNVHAIHGSGGWAQCSIAVNQDRTAVRIELVLLEIPVTGSQNYEETCVGDGCAEKSGHHYTDQKSVQRIWGAGDLIPPFAPLEQPNPFLIQARLEGNTIRVSHTITIANPEHPNWKWTVTITGNLQLVEIKEEPEKPTPFRISALALADIDNTPLHYLSASVHQYFGGHTRIHGTVTIEGEEDDQVKSLDLEVSESGTVIARTPLSAGPARRLCTVFGKKRKVSITTSELLFEIPASVFARVDQRTNGSFALQVRASSQKGASATGNYGNVEKLVLYTGRNRYGVRDSNVGGDEWVKPSVKIVIDHFSARFPELLWNDFSNMNGGRFKPHKSHQTGNDVDGWFAGYNARDAAVAARIISHLNDPTYGKRIQTVFVTFMQSGTFWNAIKDVRLSDGRQARQVIQPEADHDTHFHWRISDA